MPGLYLHIPFCVKKCSYCDFVSFPDDGGIGEYCALLEKEIRLTAAEKLCAGPFDTVFFGGGTPSLLSGAQMRRLMDTLREQFVILPDGEISMECNPGTVDGEKLAAYRAAGINRLSIGLQSADDTLLKRIGRIHVYGEFVRALALARDAGFSNINADVMHGLPGQSLDQYLDTLKKVCDLQADHISAYSLILNEETPLYGAVKSGALTLPEEDDTADMQDAGMAYLAKRGYERYEISNFAKPGFACRHNINYWENGPYLGLGVAAHSAVQLDNWTRYANVENRRDYARLLRQGVRPQAERITLHAAEEMFESVMLGLRMVRGVDRNAFTRRFGVDMAEAYPDAMAALRANGWVAETPEAIALNGKGLDVQNRALQLFF